jgi:hypothetical protein
MARILGEVMENGSRFHLLNLFSNRWIPAGHALPLLILFPFPRYHIFDKFFDVFWVIAQY